MILACIPAYNEEKAIAGVVLMTQRHVDKVIVCDDGSTDLTAEIAQRIGAVVVRHESNYGKGAALRTLLEHANQMNPDIVVTLDADGQHDPNAIPKLLEPILYARADVVIGSRYFQSFRSEVPFYRRIGLSLINLLSKGVNKSVKDTQSGFRAYSDKALDVVLQCEAKGFGIETEQLAMISRNGLRVVEVPIKIRYRGIPKTSMRNPLRHGSELIATVLRLIIEERPLLLLGVPGVLLLCLGITTGIYLLWQFNATRYFSVAIALATLAALFMGTLVFITSLVLYAIARLKPRLVKK